MRLKPDQAGRQDCRKFPKALDGGHAVRMEGVGCSVVPLLLMHGGEDTDQDWLFPINPVDGRSRAKTKLVQRSRGQSNIGCFRSCMMNFFAAATAAFGDFPVRAEFRA